MRLAHVRAVLEERTQRMTGYQRGANGAILGALIAYVLIISFEPPERQNSWNIALTVAFGFMTIPFAKDAFVIWLFDKDTSQYPDYEAAMQRLRSLTGWRSFALLIAGICATVFTLDGIQWPGGTWERIVFPVLHVWFFKAAFSLIIAILFPIRPEDRKMEVGTDAGSETRTSSAG